MEKPWHKFYEEGVPRTIKYPDILLPEILNRTVQDYPERVAAVVYDKKLTYRQLSEKVNQFANALIDIGVARNDKVAVLLPNVPAYIISAYAVLKIGAVMVSINPLYTERELIDLFRDSGAETIIVFSLFLPRVLKIQKEIEFKNIIVYPLPGALKVLDIFKKRPKEAYNFNKLIEKYSISEPKSDVKPSDVAMIQYTAGTTGLPKGVILTHRNLVANVFQLSNWHSRTKSEKDSIMCILPFFHIFGFTICVNLPVYNAFKMILLPRFDWTSIMGLIEAIKKYKPSILPAVPSIYMAMLKYPDIEKYISGSIEICNSGAAPMPEEAIEKFEKISGARFMEAYGLTETTTCTHCNPMFGKRKTGSVGIPITDTDVKIVNIKDDRKVLEPGETGEIAVKGPQVMKGYHNRTDETNKVLRDGWLYTGDIGRMDEDGYLYITDRKKDLIISDGFNIAPNEIDRVLLTHPDVSDACSIGVPDRVRGEVVKSFLVLKKGKKLTSAGIIDFCRNKLASYKLPKYVEFRTDLPKSRIGKVLRKVLRGSREKD